MLPHSTNYAQFKIVNQNREVNIKHVKKLVAAIIKKNLLHINPIIVDGNMNVIDRQHRLAAAKQLNLPVYYIVDEMVSDGDIADLNSNKSNWKLLDYVYFYSKKGNADYTKLAKFIEDHPKMSPTTAVVLLNGRANDNLKLLKNGTFQYAQEAQTLELLNKIDDFKDFEYRYDRNFIDAFHQVIDAPEYDHQYFLDKVAQQPGAFKRMANREQYVDMLEKTFNFKNKTTIANFRITRDQRARIAKANAKKHKEVKVKVEKKNNTKTTKRERAWSKDQLKDAIVKGKVNDAGKVKVQIDEKTWVYVKPGSNLAQIKSKYGKQAVYA